MRILFINSVYGTGSTGNFILNLYKLLNSFNYNSYIAAANIKQQDNKLLINIGNELDKYIHVFLTRIFDNHGFSSKNVTKKLIDKINDINPDVIHLNNLHGYYINIKILFDYIKKYNKPTIWTLHDCWPFTGHCCFFEYVNCNKWKNQCFKCPGKKQYPRSFLIDNSKRNYGLKKKIFREVNKLKIVVPSKWLFNLVKESFLNEYQIEIIYNGVDLNVFRPSHKEFRNKNRLVDKFVILGVANKWEYRKGLNYFLYLSKFLKKDEIIVLVGLNEKQLKNLPNNIIGIERTFDIKQLADIYSSADVFVNPTLEDNFPTTNIEALACGTPVITFETGGGPEAIYQGGGMVVKNKSVEDLYEAIEYIKNNRKEFSAETCREIAVKKFDYKINYLRYLDIYKELIN